MELSRRPRKHKDPIQTMVSGISPCLGLEPECAHSGQARSGLDAPVQLRLVGPSPFPRFRRSSKGKPSGVYYSASSSGLSKASTRREVLLG